MKKSKPIEEPKKPVKKKKNIKRWHKKKDPSLNSSSPNPDKASEVEQEKTPHSRKNDLEPVKKVSSLSLAYLPHFKQLHLIFQFLIKLLCIS